MTSVFEAGTLRRSERPLVSHRQDWWRGAVIYQIYPRSFPDSDGDGIGDLPGVTAKLDYVAWLGVDAIWLCPFFTSPQRDFGYDVADHTGVDPLFGTLADFDALVARAHALGLKVLIDQVWSHTLERAPLVPREPREPRQPEGGLVCLGRSAARTARRPTTGCRCSAARPGRWEPRRRQYYLHHFLVAPAAAQPAQPGGGRRDPGERPRSGWTAGWTASGSMRSTS